MSAYEKGTRILMSVPSRQLLADGVPEPQIGTVDNGPYSDGSYRLRFRATDGSLQLHWCHPSDFVPWKGDDAT